MGQMEENPEVMNKPTTLVAKRPASLLQAEENPEEAGEEQNEQTEPATPAEEARTAVRAVQKQQRLLRSFTAINERLMEKMKANRAQMRKAEKDLDSAKEVASKATRKLGAIQGAKLRKQMLAKKNKVQGQSERAAAAVTAATKRYNKLKRLMNKTRGKTSDVEAASQRARTSYEDAKKLCAKLKKEGEDVPEEGFKDVSAPGCWKAPGLKAALAREAAKVVFEKTKKVWDKKAAPNAAREERLAVLKEKINEAKANQEKVEEAMKELRKRPKK